VIGAACAPRHASSPAAPPIAAGLAIALYGTGDADTAYGVVDDRRWVELRGSELALEHIDPGASLASLVIESAGGTGALRIERCSREALPELPPVAPKPAPVAKPPAAPDGDEPPVTQITATAPARPVRLAATVRCTVEGAPGRHLVRILYVSRTLAYRAQHEVALVEPERARLVTRFAFTTPAWNEHADVTIFDGMPGGERPPTELARGPVTLDGSIAILATPARELPARLRRIYDGAVATPEVDAADVAWNAESTHTVWVWLEIPHAPLAPGPVRAHVELAGEPIRDLELAPGLRGKADAGDPDLLRLPLWADAALTGSRQRFSDPSFDPDAVNGALAERLLLSISNLGDVPREVWIEEHVRPSRHRKIERAWPKRPMSTGDVVREKIQLRPHAIERVGYTVTYEF
jgi:hypothetical protein